MAQEPNGFPRPFRDLLLNKLTGEWRITGKVAGQPLEHYGKVEWVLNHQFLKIYFLDVGSRKAQYEALVFIGYDIMAKRYVVHWLDIFGARYPQTIGYGTRLGKNSIKLVFEDSTGPLHNTLTWNPRRETWNMHIEQKEAKGKWQVFADETFQRKRE